MFFMDFLAFLFIKGLMPFIFGGNMRIIAGSLRHRIINETNLPTTRETQDRVREAIFNSIGPYFKGGKALDLFCGSGAMAIEAYSRGIDEIVLNDLNSEALNVARNNLVSLDIKRYKLYNLDYTKFLQDQNEAFDYIFVDPPYKMNDVELLLKQISESKIKKSGTIIVFEMARETLACEITNIKIIKEKNYGKKKVVFYEVL